MIKKSLAFTLTEILLTMTIIGVVASMTIPTLHYKRIKKEYSTKLKNFYSKVDNAILDMETDYGSFRDLKKPTQGKGYEWYLKYLDPYIGHRYTKNNKIYYKDGTTLGTFSTGGCLDVVYDLNGDKRPNREGYDRHRFLFCFDDTNRKSWFGSKDIFWGTYGSLGVSETTSREKLIQDCKDNPSRCTRLLENDQWEFKNDYPYKF